LEGKQTFLQVQCYFVLEFEQHRQIKIVQAFLYHIEEDVQVGKLWCEKLSMGEKYYSPSTEIKDAKLVQVVEHLKLKSFFVNRRFAL
jgi:hypothetical protein